MDKNTLIEKMLRLSNDDLRTSEQACNFRPKPLEIICYHCQQSAEKDIKAFLIFSDIEPPRIHDLGALLKLCVNINEEFYEIKKECLELTNYSVEVKYPMELEINENDIKIAIENARKIKKIVQSFL